MVNLKTVASHFICFVHLSVSIARNLRTEIILEGYQSPKVGIKVVDDCYRVMPWKYLVEPALFSLLPHPLNHLSATWRFVETLMAVQVFVILGVLHHETPSFQKLALNLRIH